jgi:thiamine-monophosphate kinase
MSQDASLTSLGDLGEFGLIEHIRSQFELQQASSVLGIGDDAALLDFNEKQCLLSTDMLVEGVHFDLSYTPLTHLGYKAAVVNISDIVAMGGTPTQLLFSLAVSNRFSKEAVDALIAGFRQACSFYEVDVVGGDTTSSNRGLVLSVTAIGEVEQGKHITRSGAQDNDLLVVTGDLGGAFLGLQVLEREKAVFLENPNAQPQLDDYQYVVGRLLKPEARKDAIDALSDLGITPTAMIDISDGLSSEALHLANASGKGVRLYEDKLPIADETFKACEEFRLNAPTVALNGGEDYELLFSIPLSDHDKFEGHPFFRVVGHVTPDEKDRSFITNQGQELPLKAQGWNALSNNPED